MITTLKTYRAFRTIPLILFTLSFLAFTGPFSVANAEEGFLVKSQEFSPVDPNSVEDLLIYLETAVKGNYDKIETWQGMMEFTSLRVYYGNDVNRILERDRIDVEAVPKSCETLGEGTINFKADLKRDMRWVHHYSNRSQGLISRDSETIQILDGPRLPVDSKVIRTPDIIMQATASQFTKKDGSIFTLRDAIKVGKVKNYLDYRDMEGFGEYPTNCFKAIGPTGYFLSALRMFVFHHDTTPKVFRDAVVIGKRSIGDDIEYYIRFGIPDDSNNNIESFYEILLPSNAGYNPTIIRILENPDKKLNREYNISYVELDGVYLPSNFQTIHYNADGMVTMCKQYTLKEQKINEVITEETFTINNLGLKDGDKFIDKIENKEYAYQAGELVEVEKAKK